MFVFVSDNTRLVCLGDIGQDTGTAVQISLSGYQKIN